MATIISDKSKVRFKPYEQDIVVELPVLLSSVLKDNVLVQLIDKIVDTIALSSLCIYYHQFGCPPYHPKMLIKVWLYGFCEGVYTSRVLAHKLKTDLGFIWLAGGQCPCFKTLSAFRSGRMQELVDVVFRQVLVYLVEEGYVNLDDLYTDGSKWEANANRHKIVWKKNTERYKKQVLERITALLQAYRELQADEDAAYGSRDLPAYPEPNQLEFSLTSEELSRHITHLNTLVEEQTDKQRKRSLHKVNKGLKDEQKKLEKYEKQEQVLAGRNSYSRTDPDATGLRMKDEQLRAGYNVQITTSAQFIVHSTIHPNASDSPTLPEHFSRLKRQVQGLVPEKWQPELTLDAGYGSEENFVLLEDQALAYMKYPSWYQKHSGKIKKKPYHSENWPYDPVQDVYTCPEQRKLHFVKERVSYSANGYESQERLYECESCANCPVFNECRGEGAKAWTNRTIRRREKLEAFRKTADERLASEKGVQKRSQRSVDVETPFGDIKHNQGHRRFILRGKEKVEVEFKLLAISHNIRKVHCEKTGIWKAYYAQRAAKSKKKRKRAA